MTVTEEGGIRQRYFGWLYDQVFEVRDPDSPDSYIYLCDVLHGIPFNDSIPNDNNRAADGEELRDEFIATQDNIGVADYVQMSSLGRASLFEVLIALSRRAHPIAESLSEPQWFRRFLTNLSLMMCSDRNFSNQDALRIGRTLRRWNNRKYDKDGKGGIFPLNRPQRDQRYVELWYQMSAYMTENKMY